MHDPITLTTPALLFPAISLLLLAYTNRFLVLAQLIRQLHGNNRKEVSSIIQNQILNLRKRIQLIKLMQALGVISFLLCTITMLHLFLNHIELGEIFFGISLLTLCASLLISLWEILISTKAIEMELEDMNSSKQEK